jgi:hypothetical protein
MLGAIAAGAVFVSGAALAGVPAFQGEAKLASPVAAPRAETISGAAWRCDGDTCVGAADRKSNLDGIVRECRKVVAVLGPVAAYKSGARVADQGQLRACNTAAAGTQTARN